MNQRGQASSVFNLLIAAIVAISILGVLLGIIKIPGFDKKPDKEAQSVLKQAISTRYTSQISADVQWPKNTAITALSLSEAAGEIDDTHICVTAGDFISDTANWVSDGKSVEYKGPQAVKSKIAAYCGTCANGGSPILKVEAGTKLNTTLSIDNCTDVPAFTTGDDSTCCIVGIVKV
jgi:hypothetical protein